MRLSALLLSLLITASCLGDTIVLKDGTRVEGDVKRTPEGWTITTADGKTRTVPAGGVKSIELGAGPKGSQQAAEGLASLRRSVDALSDIGQIIDRYQRFIENAKDPKVAADAQADLAGWREKRDKGMIKHGTKWVMPDEVAAMAAKATAEAQDARELIRQNRLKEADQAIQQALADDPLNPAALYLRGVALYRQDKVADARKAFEAVNAALPGHAPTLNNLAVLLWRQNQQAGALNYYDQAMQAQPVNKFILNNVAEALGAMPDDQRKSNTIAKALRRFSEQDLLLQQQMAQQGLYRWGGTWVDQRQLDELKAAEKQVRDKLDSMQQDFDSTKSRITQIDAEVRTNEASMADMQSRSVFLDKDGHYITFPLPQQYYELQRQNAQLRAEQQQLKNKLTSMQDEAKRVQQQVPVPRFTGVQQLVGVEGTPTPQDLAPTTGPTSAESTSLRD
jgi:Flp pilus assembly protein TadD